MPNLLEQITKDIADAMRQKNQATLAPLRMLKAALMNRKSRRDGRRTTPSPRKS